MFEDQFPVHFFCPKITGKAWCYKPIYKCSFNNVYDFPLYFTFCCSQFNIVTTGGTRLTTLPGIKSGGAELKTCENWQNGPKRAANQSINHRPHYSLVFTVRNYGWLIDWLSVLVRFVDSRMFLALPSTLDAWHEVTFDQQNENLNRDFGKSFVDGTAQHPKKPQQSVLAPSIVTNKAEWLVCITQRWIHVSTNEQANWNCRFADPPRPLNTFCRQLYFYLNFLFRVQKNFPHLFFTSIRFFISPFISSQSIFFIFSFLNFINLFLQIFFYFHDFFILPIYFFKIYFYFSSFFYFTNLFFKIYFYFHDFLILSIYFFKFFF